jgi:DNA polymerase III alpha subunit/intein/homing endonuclease
VLDFDHLCLNAEGLWCTALPNCHPQEIEQLKNAFGSRLSLAVRRLMDGEDAKNLRTQTALSENFGVPLVATGGVRFAKPEEKPVLDVLHCIRNGTTLDEAGRALMPNAERCLRPENAVRARFANRPELLSRTREIADACRFSMRQLHYRFPCELDGIKPGADANALLRKLAYDGARSRYGASIPERVRTLLEKELALIADLEVAPYFLSVWDVVEMARRRDILCQGRGSAANSAVCFCLGITAVDPSRSSLLFERFLSPERKEPPDIDVDFEHERREEVIQDIYAKYGRDRAAMVSEVVSYRGRSALREVGKVFGLSLEQVERLSGLVSWWDGVEVPATRLRDAGFDPGDERTHRILAMSAAIQGFPRHLSIHVGGFVLSAAPLAEIAPVQPATMPGRTVVPWDKDDIDVLGFFKMDVLGLGILTAIRKAMDLASELPSCRAAELGSSEAWKVESSAIERLAKVPSEDPRVYDALCEADTVGVFQIESRAQMAMLPRLKPRGFYDLVIEVAIVRPGPIQGGMVHPYLRRRNGEEPIDFPHPSLVPILDRTLGVPLFQEQVMQISIVGAGYSPGEADQLRRDMAAWRRNGRLERHRERLRIGFLKKGITEEFSERLYAQIQGFGEYGFPECVVGETQIVDASTGRRVAIEDVAHGKIELETTFACDERFRLRKRRVLKATCSGKREVFRLKTALGRSVTATAEHPLLTMNGWRPLASLKAGEHVAVARELASMGQKRWKRHELIVLGDLIAEGNLSHPTTFYFYTTDSGHADEFVSMIERFPNTRATVARHKACFSIHVRRGDRKKLCGALEWAGMLGLRGFGAREKKLPKEVFELHVDDIALLLARMWEGDGHLSNARHASYDTASPVLAEQVQHLLLRLGIVARLYRRDRPYRGRIATGYTITITGAENLRHFDSLIARRFLGKAKRKKSKDLAKATKGGRMSLDLVPCTIRAHIRAARAERGLTWKQIGTMTGLAMREIGQENASKGGFRRWVIARLAEHLKSEKLHDLGNSDVYWDRVVSIEPIGMRETYDLTIEGDHNFLANDIIVHNSHASSFALLVYSSAWLKVHHPAAFAAALVNSQPMGFYTPSTIFEDARRHGVKIEPVCIAKSDWDCTLENAKTIRTGLRLVKGLGEEIGRRIVLARGQRMFESIEDLAARGEVGKKELAALAESGALEPLAEGRRNALWKVVAPRSEGIFFGHDEGGEPARLPRLSRTEQLVLDFERTGTSPDHPMKLMRSSLPPNVLSSRDMAGVKDGKRAKAAGMVICRQRPGTASGIVFMTLEDEYGFVNLVLYARVFDHLRHVATTSPLVLAEGLIQREGSVVHLVVQNMRRLALPTTMPPMSRDFH